MAFFNKKREFANRSISVRRLYSHRAERNRELSPSRQIVESIYLRDDYSAKSSDNPDEINYFFFYESVIHLASFVAYMVRRAESFLSRYATNVFPLSFSPPVPRPPQLPTSEKGGLLTNGTELSAFVIR